MAKNKKRTQLSSEGKTELAKAIAEKSQNFAKTYANVENQIGKFFRWLSGWLDKLLFNQKHGKLVALVLALFFYIAMSGGEDLFKTDEISKSLGKLKVEQRISTEIYEVNNLPDEVEVTAIGDISDIKNMKSQNIKIVANMTDLTEGTHDVTLEVENAPNRVKIIVEPSNATVTIKKKVIKRFSVGFDYVNRSSMNNRYDLSEPELEQGEVFVRASKDTLDKIAYVKALIKVDADTTKDFEQQATIVAYDQDGNKMDNVDIIPGDMKAKVKVTSPSKDVELTLVPTGNVPDNKAIESYTMDHETITLYGKQEALDKIDELPITIPASTLTQDREISMPVPLMNGVSATNVDVVNISIKLADLKDTVVKDVPIEIINGTKGLNYSISGSKTSDVTVKGAKKVIDKIEKGDIKITVDVSKIDKAGTYNDMALSVEGKNKLATYELKNASISVNVTGSAE